MQVQGDRPLSWYGTYTERHTKSLQLPQIKNQDFTTQNPFRFYSISQLVNDEKDYNCFQV